MRVATKVRIGTEDLDDILSAVESGRFDVVQSYCILINPSAGWEVLNGFTGYDFKRLIDHAMGREMGVAAIRVMAAGAVGGERARSGHASPRVS